jgi:hypothetical protein
MGRYSVDHPGFLRQIMKQTTDLQLVEVYYKMFETFCTIF